ncbi:putative zinc ion binding protein [Hibiscus syriacus]|uniref:Zinc ion binding protein n=1 Tax=Hibiscus syriacus TaxID=106335 RepID=A0A6A2Z4J8_HIBSY|nr:putative zinc ion binding protein [Hibiscus syriacus]
MVQSPLILGLYNQFPLRQQILMEFPEILLTIRSHRLERLLTGTAATPPETVVDDDGTIHVNGEYEDFVAQDSALASWLLSTISPHLLPQFVSTETATVVWNTVLRFFANRSTTAIMSLHYKLQSLKKGGDSMRTYLTRVKEVCDALASCGSSVPLVEQVASILKGLHREYQPFMAIITSMRETLSLDNISTMLIDAETQIASFDDHLDSLPMSANIAQDPGFNANFVGKLDIWLIDVGTCMIRASRALHLEVNDSINLNTKLIPPLKTLQPHLLMMASERWVVDTGATHHVTAYANKLLNASEYRGPGKLLIENGMPLDIVSVGSARVNTTYRILFLHELLHVPNITKNLLSVSNLARDNDVFIEFYPNRCCIRDEATGKLLLQGEESDGLYFFDLNYKPSAVCCAQANTCTSSTLVSELWHQRLGHPTAETLEKLASELGFKVNSDKLVANQFGSSIKALQTDWGGEFRSISTLLARDGIAHILTCPYTSEQNGVVERKHRHIVELALVLLAQASLPIKYWSYAVVSTVYLINRLPTKVLRGISPFEKLFARKPKYSMMKGNPGMGDPLGSFSEMNDSILQLVSEQVTGSNPPGKEGSTSVKLADKASPSSRSLSIVAPASTVCHHLPNTISAREEVGNTYVPREVELINNEVDDTEVPHEAEVVTNEDQYNPDDILQQSSDAVTTSKIVLDSEAVNNLPSTRVHHMMTRSRCGIFKPKVFSTTLDDDTPMTISVTLQSPQWAAAVHDEYNALLNNNTWSLVRLPKDRVVVGCKWLFRVKHNFDGSVNRYKARLVAKGFSQVSGYDFKDTFSPVVRFATFNVILSIAVSNGWELQHVDINNAFLNGDLNDEVYMQQPPGFEQTNELGEPLVCKLKKELYGLRQAPRNWHVKLKETLVQMGFKVFRADSSLFTKYNEDGGYIYVLVYVDDIVIIGPAPTAIHQFVSTLQTRFSLKDLGELSFFLELLEKTGMLNASNCATPMVVSPKLSHEEGQLIQNASEYRSVVGSLLYVCHTRPDITFSVGQVAQHMHAPCEMHFVAVKTILRYLASTLNFGLLFTPVECGPDIIAFADANWGASIDDRRSITGYGVFLSKSLVTWCPKKQRKISRSTMEAEYKSVADTVADITWIQALLADHGIQQNHTPVVWCDNTSAVAMSANPVYHAQSKHVDLDVHFVREKVAVGQLCIRYSGRSRENISNVCKQHMLAMPRWHSLLNQQFRSFAREPFSNKLTHYLQRAKLIDSIRVALHSSSPISLNPLFQTRLLDSFVVANAFRSAPSADSAVSFFENLKQVPNFEHSQNSVFAFATVLAKFKRKEELKALIGDVKDGKFNNVKVSFMNLLFWYSTAEDLQEVFKTWEEYTSEENRLSTEARNIVIGLYAQKGMDFEAVKAFRGMIDQGAIPNSRTYTILIQQLVRLGKLDTAMEVFTLLPSMRIKRTLKQFLILVEGFVGGERFDVVESLLKEMREDGKLPGRAMRVYLGRMKEAGFGGEADEFLVEMLPDGRIKSVGSCEGSNDEDGDEDEDADEDGDDNVNEGVDIHMVKLKPWVYPKALANALKQWNPEVVTIFEDAKFVWTSRLVCKVLRNFTSAETAWNFFCWVASQPGFSHDIYTVQRMMTLLGRHGNNADAALKVFRDDRSLCGHISRFNLMLLYSSLLRALTKSHKNSDALGGDIKTVQQLISVVRQNGMEQDAYMYKLLIQAYGKCQRAALANRVFEDMRNSSLMPDAATKDLLVKSPWQEGKRKEAVDVEDRYEEADAALPLALRGYVLTVNSEDLTRVYNIYCKSVTTSA